MTNKIRTKLRLLAAAVAATACASLAHAESPATALDKRVHGVVAVGGSAGSAERTVVDEAVEAALTSAGWILPEMPPAKEILDKMLGCKTPAQPWTCVPVTVLNQQIGRAMVVSVEPKPTTNGLPMVAVTATVISPSKSAFVVLQRPCEQCTPDKLKQVSTALVVQLLKDLASRAGDTAIEAVSLPPNAEVTIDGQKTGATDSTFTTFPGEHTLIIEKAGYEPETRTVQVKDGQTVSVSVKLQEHAAPSRVIPIALMAGGAALIGGGIGLALDQQDSATDKFKHQRSSAIGISVGGVGVAAVAVGLYLWLRSDDTHAPPKDTPSIATVRGGAVFGWTGSF